MKAKTSKIKKAAYKPLTSLTMLALLVSSFGVSVGPIVPLAHAVGEPVTVTITKYIDGQLATSALANSQDFPMSATWEATNLGGPGTGEYALSASNEPPYQATTVNLDSGSSYSTYEFTDRSVVGLTCTESKPFSLIGYTTGETMEEAAAGTPTMVVPSFTAMTTNKFVIVWNHDCSVVIPPEPTTVKVTINKYIDGAQATAASADSASFPMTATWAATNMGAGTGEYALSASGYNGDPTPYQAMTGEMSTGADYTTSELTNGSVVGASCSEDKPFALVGYTSGDTLAEAAAATPSPTAPAFTGMTGNKYVIVWNHNCSNTEGTIGGEVTGGTSPHGTLAVTSVDAVDTTATADGTFANGWKYVFNITVPDNETGLAMKFADWTSTPAGNSFAAANNIRISSAQADNSGATVLVTAANTYTVPNLNMTGDLNAGMAGKQVQVTVEVAIPSNTVNGSYGTTYGIRTQ